MCVVITGSGILFSNWRLVLFLGKGFDKAGKSLALAHTETEIPGHIYKCKEFRLPRV